MLSQEGADWIAGGGTKAAGRQETLFTDGAGWGKMGDQAGTYSLHEEKGDFERCMKMQEENVQSIKI